MDVRIGVERGELLCWNDDPELYDALHKWNVRMLEMARLVSTWSKDPSTRCGAAIFRPDRTIASVGYNGFPRGCSDAKMLYADREEKYGRVVHAELNAILSAREPLHGYSMATWPPGGAPSCDRCTAAIIQAGIRKVVHVVTENDFTRRWAVAMQRSLAMYREAGVEVVAYPLGEK